MLRVAPLPFSVFVLKSNFFFYISVRFRATSGLDAAVDPIQMKNVTFDHVKGVSMIWSLRLGLLDTAVYFDMLSKFMLLVALQLFLCPLRCLITVYGACNFWNLHDHAYGSVFQNMHIHMNASGYTTYSFALHFLLFISLGKNPVQLWLQGATTSLF